MSGIVRKSFTAPVARLAGTMGSPTMLATCVVALVVGIGALCTFYNYHALCRAGEQRAADILHAQRAAVGSAFDRALGTADALLARIAPHVAALDQAGGRERLLSRMHELATARPGLRWLSASLSDGTFVGVYIDGEGRLRGEQSHVGGEGGGIQRTYAFGADGLPEQLAGLPTSYDPRSRGFYQTAARVGRRAWTAPYAFFADHRTGISRVLPLFRDGPQGRALHAVLTADFDTTSLAQLLQRPLTRSQRQLVLASDGSVLAASGVNLPARTKPPDEAALNWAELRDAPLSAARVVSSLGSSLQALGARTIPVQGAPWRLEVAQIARLDGAPITLLSMLPERELFASAHREAARGLVATALTALLGFGLAMLLSANISRLRRERAEATRDAERAREQVAELGSYQLLAPLAAGGMGEIYRARHKLLARDAALKLIKSSGSHGAHELELRKAQFFQEAKVLASLRSAHTVAVYDFGIASDGRYFLAMELLEGLDLDALVRDHGPQPAARVAAILAQVCDSLAEAHAAGLVHRDIKPANIFLCCLAQWLDVVKVLDFGLTRAVASGAEPSAVEGTPSYMSPEQALCEPVAPSSDLYSVGCVGFWLLSGNPPYADDDPVVVMEAHVSAPVPQLPRAIRASTPPALVQLLTRCLAKHAEHRPVSAAVLGRAFRAVARESSDTFSAEMQIAFWQTRPARRNLAVDAEPTLPMTAVQRLSEAREAG
jgi:tRNA A-37 threonylcarbamoyl transferase component Bud32